MPLRGTKPGEHAPRRRNKPTHEWVEIVDAPFDDPPELPRDIGWPAATLRWWAAISRMPHAVLWIASDWSFALDSAIVSASFHGGNLAAANELRHREKVMGTTLDSRRDLRICYVPAEEEEESTRVTVIAEYKRRLAGS